MKNTMQHPLRFKTLIPHLIVILWLLYLGAMIWQHNVLSLQSPQYDALTYMQKAMNFWKAVDQGKLFNPLNIEPTVRPPGTVLMSYPFGFSSDFKGFHFRSVFFPILCIVMAVYMTAGIPQTSAAGWGVATVAIFFSAIPMFYQFDCNEFISGPTYWGLVDNFQSGIAAMSAAALIRSLIKRSQAWLLIGLILASFTLLIKPSGLMVMALSAATWVIIVVLEWVVWTRKFQQSDSSLRAYVFLGMMQFIIVYATVFLLCILSKYFSIENYFYAKRALLVLGEVMKTISSRKIISVLFTSTGIVFVLWAVGNGFLYIYSLIMHNEIQNPLSTKMAGFFVSSLVIWCLGGFYWLFVQAGGDQVRYFYPFFLMGAVCMIPISLHVWSYTHRWVRLTAMVLCFLPALNIGTLLALESPSIQWQCITGVNVSVGKDQEEVNQAYTFLNELRKQHTSANLYAFHTKTLEHIFITIGMYEGIVRPDLPFFKTTLTIDWMHGFGVRVQQLLDADYILIRKDIAQNTQNSLVRQIDTYDSECAVFQAWLYGLSRNARVKTSYDLECAVFQAWLFGLDRNAGVKTVSDGSVLRLLEIFDRRAFGYAVESFVAGHSWRPEFVAVNPQRWWNKEDVSGYAANVAAEEIDFKGIYTLHALSLHHSDEGLKVEIWWEELGHEDANKQWYMFFHLVDQSGRILSNLSMPLDQYSPLFDNRKWRYGSVTFEQPLPDEANSLAFGIFHPNHPNHDFLMPDKGVRDWGGMRVLVPIPDSAS
jgi:hypothetical protein